MKEGIKMELSLTPSLENYLKMILKLQQYGDSVRVTDLAEKLSIAKSSVNQAVGILKKQGLVTHERYGPLELTDKGIHIASSIIKRHDMLMRFMTNILGVDPIVAEADACQMEHAVSCHTIEKLSAFMEKLGDEQCNQEHMEQRQSTNKILKKLDTVLPVTKVKVVKIATKGVLERRLMEMGITPGIEIIVESYAPMGDPIGIKLRGYNLAIRKSEAKEILVEIIE